MASAPGIAFSSTRREGTTEEHREFEILDDKLKYFRRERTFPVTRVALATRIPIVA
jgi:hypothetical protein